MPDRFATVLIPDTPDTITWSDVNEKSELNLHDSLVDRKDNNASEHYDDSINNP